MLPYTASLQKNADFWALHCGSSNAVRAMRVWTSARTAAAATCADVFAASAALKQAMPDESMWK
jgi:hypothetical protein